MQDFVISTHLNYPEYFRMQFKLRYSKLWIKLVSLLGILYLMAYLIALKFYHFDFWNSDISAIGFFLVYFAVVYPLLSWYMVRRSFKGNQRIQEPIIYRLSEQGIVCTGESFSSNYSWDKLYKVQTYHGWLLLYQSSLGYNLIKLQPKDEAQLKALKEFLQSQKFKMKIKM